MAAIFFFLLPVSLFRFSAFAWARARVEVRSNNRILTVNQDGTSTECLLAGKNKPVRLRINGPGYLVLWPWPVVRKVSKKIKIDVFEDNVPIRTIVLGRSGPRGRFEETRNIRPGSSKELGLKVKKGVHSFMFRVLGSGSSTCIGFSFRLRSGKPVTRAGSGQGALEHHPGELPAVPLVPVAPLASIKQPTENEKEDEKKALEEQQEPPERPPTSRIKAKLASGMPELPGEEDMEQGKSRQREKKERKSPKERMRPGSALESRPVEQPPITRNSIGITGFAGLVVPSGMSNPFVDLGLKFSVNLPLLRKMLALFAAARYRYFGNKGVARSSIPTEYKLSIHTLPLYAGIEANVPTGTPIMVHVSAGMGYFLAWAESRARGSKVSGSGGGLGYVLALGASLPLGTGRAGLFVDFSGAKADAEPVCRNCDVGGLSILLNYRIGM